MNADIHMKDDNIISYYLNKKVILQFETCISGIPFNSYPVKTL